MADPGVQAPLHKNRKATLPRIENFISSARFKEVNLIDRLYPEARPADLSYWTVPGGEGAWQQYSFEDAISQTYTPTTIGSSFGPTWSTHWFKVLLTIPAEWTGKEVRFRWDSGSEATLWSKDGTVLQGLSSSRSHQVRTDYVLSSSYGGSTPSLTLYVEMAGNRIMGTTNGDQIDPPPPDMTFQLVRAEVSFMDTMVYKLTRDLEVLSQIASDLGEDARGYAALFTANQMVNSIIAGNDQSASDLADVHFSKGNGARAHNLAAIGNCHIDTAWLWPYSETKRKVARSFSSQLVLMDQYPDYIFVASQAQQWAWCKQHYPQLFERIKARVAEGRFLPVGSTWIEMDGNIPSGESFVRQFLHGQRFYEQELGVRCQEFWLPDTFGYSPQIPGIMRHMGLSRFLTQKLSWSFVNKFPHHNFTWEGIDGSRVLAHFPPGNTYEMNVTAKEARFSESNLQDKGRVSTSAFLYGYGDGGGGPTQDMLERANRMKDVDGVPRIQQTTPNALFTRLEAEQHNFCQWTGELYLELHNGTYTSQAAMKRLCRAAEFLLRDTEFLLCVAVAGAAGNKELLASSLKSLDEAWKKVLLNQFHDVIPGCGIGIIYPEARRYYEEAMAAARDVWSASVAALYGSGEATTGVVFNSLQWPRRQVVNLGALAQQAEQQKEEKLPGKEAEEQKTQLSSDAKAANYRLVTAPAFGYSSTEAVTPSNPVTLVASGDKFVLCNGLVRAVVSSTGQLTSLAAASATDRDVFVTAAGQQLAGNKLLLYDDQPLYWDAWDVMDYHLETQVTLNDESIATPVTITESGSLRCSLSWGCKVGRTSTLVQEISLTADCPYVTFQTSVDWSENRKLLKVGFDTSIHTSNATYDTQFGALQRPTAVNTSWDSARYEVCGHKWATLAEPGWGVAVLNDSKYGWCGRGSSLTLTLLRSPKAPDDTCDMGQHTFAYAVMPFAGALHESGVVQRGYEFNNPLKYELLPSQVVATQSSQSYCGLEGTTVEGATVEGATVEGATVVLHTIKPAEDGSGDVVLRLFESMGCRGDATVKLSLPVSAVTECNGMEDPGEALDFTQADGVTSIPVKLTPFKILALRVTF